METTEFSVIVLSNKVSQSKIISCLHANWTSSKDFPNGLAIGI